MRWITHQAGDSALERVARVVRGAAARVHQVAPLQAVVHILCPIIQSTRKRRNENESNPRKRTRARMAHAMRCDAMLEGNGPVLAHPSLLVSAHAQARSAVVFTRLSTHSAAAQAHPAATHTHGRACARAFRSRIAFGGLGHAARTSRTQAEGCSLLAEPAVTHSGPDHILQCSVSCLAQSRLVVRGARRAKPSRAEPSRAEPSRAEPSPAGVRHRRSVPRATHEISRRMTACRHGTLWPTGQPDGWRPSNGSATLHFAVYVARCTLDQVRCTSRSSPELRRLAGPTWL
jgi:hypothetical protein